MARKKTKIELENLLEQLCRKIKDHFELDEMLLYGSYAKGLAHELSDVDVTVISPSLKHKSILGNVMDISRKIKFYDPDLQLTAFSPDAFYNETFIDPGFIREIKRTGKQIYTKAKGLDFSSLANLSE
jgi:predicted nucleotidyltransferase